MSRFPSSFIYDGVTYSWIPKQKRNETDIFGKKGEYFYGEDEYGRILTISKRQYNKSLRPYLKQLEDEDNEKPEIPEDFYIKKNVNKKYRAKNKILYVQSEESVGGRTYTTYTFGNDLDSVFQFINENLSNEKRVLVHVTGELVEMPYENYSGNIGNNVSFALNPYAKGSLVEQIIDAENNDILGNMIPYEFTITVRRDDNDY